MYEYAREGKKVELEPREVEIYSIKLININEEENIITIETEVSKGTYIRTLCSDIAKELGTIGIMNNLKRIKVR